MNSQCSIVILACFFALAIADEPASCITPNGETARCERIRSCKVLKEALDSEDPSIEKFVDASVSSCKGATICCGTHANYTQDANKEEQTEPPLPPLSKKDYAIKHLLPGQRICGMQHTDDYFYNESRTSVDEFPWLVGVYYDDRRTKRSPNPKPVPNIIYVPCRSEKERRKTFRSGPRPRPCRSVPIPKVTYKCTGVLISNRYALTSGSCGSQSNEPMKVLLGQYEENKRVTCIKTNFGEDDCTHPSINVTVEERIRSPNNSLLLLRLQDKVLYTDYVRPICLPMNETIRPQIDDAVFTSGWGFQTTNDNATVVKKRIRQNIANSEVCKKEFPLGHLCTKLKSYDDYVCKTDRGGPLMYRYKHKNWYVESVIDVNQGCVNDTVVSAKITPELVNWILENMRN